MIIRKVRLWKSFRVIKTILLHPFQQNPLCLLFNSEVNLLIDDKEEIKSFCILVKKRDHVQLRNVFTSKEFRGQGLATQLIKTVLKGLKLPVYIQCPDYRVSFYKRFGFLETQQMPFTVRFFKEIGNFFSQIFKGNSVVAMIREP